LKQLSKNKDQLNNRTSTIETKVLSHSSSQKTLELKICRICSRLPCFSQQFI